MVDTHFLDELASAKPTPGGGGAAAYVGAVAASCASMVVHLTIGKPRYAEVEERMKSLSSQLDTNRERLIELVKADAEAYAPVAAAYKMPKDTSEQSIARDAALQEALIGACEVPLTIMRVCLEVIEACSFAAREGSVLARSDAAAGAFFAKAALITAALNVYTNVDTMTDAARAEDFKSRADMLICAGSRQADEVTKTVADALHIEVLQGGVCG